METTLSSIPTEAEKSNIISQIISFNEREYYIRETPEDFYKRHLHVDQAGNVVLEQKAGKGVLRRTIFLYDGKNIIDQSGVFERRTDIRDRSWWEVILG